MSIESNIFKRYTPNLNECPKNFEKNFLDNSFKAVLSINDNGEVVGAVIDLENNDDFLPLRIENNEGSFAGKIRSEYEKILTEFRDKYFIKNYFIYPQSNRIAHAIIKKYGNKPEFLWEKFDGSAIFRNRESKKWYAGILDVEGNKIKKSKSGIIEVLDIKLNPEEIKNLLTQPHFYPAYHMNKKSWITVILDESLADKTIMLYVDKSYRLSFGKSKKTST